MKIHRVTTVNLNSLYGEQEVDLEATLGGASLFLIYGPTGSGKSTLMDAVSLALFGVTPRLDAAKGNESRDPRAIMSRGTGECSAEVVFSKIEGGGRKTYRAKWSCWRARKDPERALQDQVRDLERLEADGTTWELMVSSKRKKDFAPVFKDVLEGFEVRDFNRSMLLAQGQFDAFLGAPAHQRAEILERLTDTSIYQRLGERAARIRGRHKRRLEALRTLAAAGGGLDDAVLTELEKAHGQHVEELEKQKKAYGQAELHLKWFDRDIELRGKLAEAKAEEKKLTEDAHDAEDALARLAEHDRCEEKKAFRLLDAHGSAQGQVTRGQEQLAKLDESLPGLEEAAKDKGRVATATAASARLAEQHIEALRPLAAGADKAEEKHTTATKLASDTATKKKEADGQVDEAEEKLTKATGALAEAKNKAEEAQAEFEKHASVGELVSQWDPLRTRLDRLVATSESEGKKAETLATRGGKLKGDRMTLGKDQAAHETARKTALEPATEALKQANETLTQRMSQPDFDASREQAADSVEDARARRDAIKDAVEPVTSARNAAARLDEASTQIESAEGELTEASESLGGLSRDVEHNKELESRAREALDRTEQVAALVEQRVALVDGEPCALCGSEEHPWAHDPDRKAADAVISETVTAAEKAYDDERKAHDDAKRRHQEADAARQGLVAKLDLLKSQHGAAKQEQTELDRTAAAALKALRLPEDSSTAELDEARLHADRALEKTDKALSELDTAQGRVSEAERQLREATENQEKAEGLLRDRAVKLEERATQLETDRTQHAEAREASAGELAACRTLLTQHGLALEGVDPAIWRDLGDQRRREHEARVKAVSDLAALLENTATARKGAENLCGERKTQRDKLVEQLGVTETDRHEKRLLADRARETMVVAWQSALTADEARPTDGSPPLDASPQAFVDAQKTWLDRAKAAELEASKSLRSAQNELTGAKTQRETLAKGQADLVSACDRARGELHSALVALALSDDQQLLALRLGDDRLVELRKAKKDLDDRKLQIETRIRERQEAVDTQTSARPATLADEAERDVLVAEVTGTKTLHEGAVQAHQETGDQLRDHHRAVQAQEEHRRLLSEAEKQARVWQTLHQYIGVNDGGKFKEFAQALNLGQLLDKANVHLARLAKRYRLVSRLEDGLPTLEFDLSDLWQVGERVAPRSLSGGERFLVSLSLALGLSDFRAVKMPIETLLLDEGFGTLDPDALSVALGALSQLQADGRQVGIISHVAGLQERIEARIEVRALGGGRSEVRPTG